MKKLWIILLAISILTGVLGIALSQKMMMSVYIIGLWTGAFLGLLVNMPIGREDADGQDD